MELKQIEISKIKPNLSQPREHFDDDKIKELAESILSNGLINPITVRQDGNNYFIVAGERRWKAHKVAGLKNIDAFIKEYKDEGAWMIESLIENIHREDLQNMEKAKFLLKIKNIENLSNEKLSKRVGMGETVIRSLLNIISIDDDIKKVGMPTSDYDTLSKIASMEDKSIRDRLLKKGKTTENFRQVVRAIGKAPTEVKDALLDDKITVDQAERISKLKEPEERKKAIQEHKNIKLVDNTIEKNIENGISNKEKREIDKKLIKSKNFILSFRNSITDSKSSIEQSIKTLMLCIPLIPIMDEKQRSDLDTQLDRFLEILDRGKQIAEQIQNKLEEK